MFKVKHFLLYVLLNMRKTMGAMLFCVCEGGKKCMVQICYSVAVVFVIILTEFWQLWSHLRKQLNCGEMRRAFGYGICWNVCFISDHTGSLWLYWHASLLLFLWSCHKVLSRRNAVSPPVSSLSVISFPSGCTITSYQRIYNHHY